jgi:hypothetical protein
MSTLLNDVEVALNQKSGPCDVFGNVSGANDASNRGGDPKSGEDVAAANSSMGQEHPIDAISEPDDANLQQTMHMSRMRNQTKMVM